MTRRALFVATALLALLIPATALAAAPGPKPPLSANGYFFTDASGRAVFMHGFNMVYKVGSYAPSDFGFGADDARFLRRHGFNTIRLGLIYKGLEPDPPGPSGRPAYDVGYLDKIAKTERVLAKHRIFSLLDFHQDMYNERFEGEGWPDWQTFDDGQAAEPKNGFPANYLFMQALNTAFDHFWANDPAEGVGLQDRYAMAWRFVAERFGGNPYVMGYDLMNEPWPGSAWPGCASTTGCPAFDAGPLTDFSNRTIAAIRDVDDETLVFWEPLLTFDFGAATAHADTGDPSAGFSFHDYCIAGALGSVGIPITALGVPEGTTCAELEELVFQNAQGVAERTGDVPFLTEFSATDDAETNERLVRLADEYMVSWQSWHYCDCDDPTTAGPGIQSLVIDPREPPRGENVKREKLALFSRPYPRAVAGTPIGFEFDPESRAFDFAYRTEPVGGGRLSKRTQTEVFVPPIHYHGDYAVDVEGAKVVSKPGRRVLRLRNARGAKEVRVRVVPG
ncbi:MAG TPA: cellulase family glycosylhydrolase [Solirubrobacterales bacterium]